MNSLENVVSRFLPAINVPPVTLPEEYKSAVNRINELVEGNPESGSFEEMELLAIASKISTYEKSLFHAKVYYQ